MGKAVHQFEISLAEAANCRIEDILSSRKNVLLSLLPLGSLFIDESTSMSCFGTTIQYSVTIDHPFFPDDSRIEVDMTRICWKNGEGNGFPIGIDSIVTGIRYLDKEGKSFLPT